MDIKFDAALKQILDPKNPNECRPVPFWSWNSRLEPEELVRQVNQLYESGHGGFIMHARMGLETEYLGEEWMRCIEVCCKEAKHLGMQAWIYDENGWPSGFVGGKLLSEPRFRAKYLTMQEKTAFDETAFAVFEKKNGRFRRLREKEHGENYFCVYCKSSSSNTDILNAEVTDAFIRNTHELYFARFSEYFGSVIKGFFTDEPQYYRTETPFTPALVKDFRELYGEDVRDGLIYLFFHDEKGYLFRWRYYSLLHRYYIENYYKKLYDWCDAHGCMLTGHSIEESCLYGQMWGSGGVAETYAFEHIPAIDFLGRHCPGLLAAKQVAGAAQQLGKKYILTETFACGGHNTNPILLKSVGESQFFQGVNILCAHLYPYTVAKQGKYDHPPVFSPHANWWKGYRVFNDYFTMLGQLIAHTQEVADVAVINPVKSLYFEYVRKEDYASVKELEDSFAKLLDSLRREGVLFQLIDEDILAAYGSVYAGSLRVGSCIYKRVVLPPTAGIRFSTLSLLREYSESGGCLMLAGGSPPFADGKPAPYNLPDTMGWHDLLLNRRISVSAPLEHAFITARKGECGEFLFLKNMSQEEPAEISIEGLGKSYAVFDLAAKRLRAAEDTVVLSPAGGEILIRTEEAPAKEIILCSQDITDRLQFAEETENCLLLDRVCVSKNGKEYSDEKFVGAVFKRLLWEKYCGPLYLRINFTVENMPPELRLLAENMGCDSVFCNGIKLRLQKSQFDCNYIEGKLAGLRQGGNILEFRLHFHQKDEVWSALFDPDATENLRNCLCYDTNLAPVYLCGHFTVGQDLSIKKPAPRPVRADLQKYGLPFFCGAVTYVCNYRWNGERAELRLCGEYMMAEISANGKSVLLVLQNSADITGLLQQGDNRLQIKIYSSLRNMFGPHHYGIEAEPNGVYPPMFTFLDAGMDDDFTSEYQLVDFGLRKAEIIVYKTVGLPA